METVSATKRIHTSMSEITVENSMLEQAARMHDKMRKLRPEDVGKDALTFLQRPYARAQPAAAVSKASVWFTAYMPSIIGPQRDGSMQPPLGTLADPALWQHFAELGIRAVHTGPVMKAGGYLADGEPYASIDGWFDPIALDIDADLGTETDYRRLRAMADTTTNERGEQLHAVVIGDIVPGHTGMGADFHLALQGVDHYPGLYVLARVDELLAQGEHHEGLTADEIASLTAELPDGELSRLLTKTEVRALLRVQVIPGQPQRTLGAQAGEGWSITRGVEGAGGITRRWVYLHFFHPKQPTLNFLDSGYAAWRMVTGQLNYVVWDLRSTGVRLDANAFLGIEPLGQVGSDAGATQTWSEAHPLSATVTNMLAWQARRLGGFSFEEKNLTVQDIAKSGEFGPDLAYDFITRPAVEHALLTGKVALLDFMFAEMQRHGVKPGMLVHALQNHDEFTYELVHLASLEGQAAEAQRNGLDAPAGFTESAASIRADMRRYGLGRDGETDDQLRNRAPGTSFNRESPNGLCTTMAGLIAARLGAKTLTEATRQIDDIRRGHLLLAAFNALQPGVFAVSGWDLVGALPVPEIDVPAVLLNAGDSPKEWKDKDFRWVNRGAYRLLSSYGDPTATYGVFCLPEAQTLYGTLDQQHQDPTSFFHQLRRMLQVREQLEIPVATFAGTLTLPDTSLFGFRLWTPYKGHRRAVVTLFNFAAPNTEPVPMDIRQLLAEQWPNLHWDENEIHTLQHCPDGTNGWSPLKPEDSFTIAPWEWKLIRFTPIDKDM